MWCKVTNCTTTTGGGKLPLRKRKNQNITIKLSNDIVPLVGKKLICFRNFGRMYYTTYESKVKVLK